MCMCECRVYLSPAFDILTHSLACQTCWTVNCIDRMCVFILRRSSAAQAQPDALHFT